MKMILKTDKFGDLGFIWLVRKDFPEAYILNDAERNAYLVMQKTEDGLNYYLKKCSSMEEWSLNKGGLDLEQLFEDSYDVYELSYEKPFAVGKAKLMENGYEKNIHTPKIIVEGGFM